MVAINTLIEQLGSSEVSSQISAAETLAVMAEEGQPAIVALVQHCGSSDEDLCNWCTAALEQIGQPTANQIEELAELARSANTNVAFWAATLLGRAGSLAESATSVLSDRSNDSSSPEVQQRAVWALERIRAA